jgi:hypothetical protein
MNLHNKFAFKNQRTNTLLYRVDQKNMVYIEITVYNDFPRFSFGRTELQTRILIPLKLQEFHEKQEI